MVEKPEQPPRGSNGQFVTIPESMPAEHRPDTVGPSIHVYRDEGDAREMLGRVGKADEIKTVKKDGRVEYHLRQVEERTESAVSVQSKVTCGSTVEDFE